jgi:hypothetical protein
MVGRLVLVGATDRMTVGLLSRTDLFHAAGARVTITGFIPAAGVMVAQGCFSGRKQAPMDLSITRSQ